MSDPSPHAPVGAPLLALLRSDFGLARRVRPVIGIAGESGSGKTTAATELASALTAAGMPAAVLHQDDYFLRPPRTNHLHRERDLSAVGPHEVDLARLQGHIAAFRAGANGVRVPQVDYPNDRFLEGVVDFAPLAALVVEGTYVLALDGLDVRVFCAATHGETRERRRVRNRDIDAPFVEQVLEIEHALIAPQAARADVVIDRDFRVARRAGSGSSG